MLVAREVIISSVFHLTVAREIIIFASSRGGNNRLRESGYLRLKVAGELTYETKSYQTFKKEMDLQ